MKMKLKEFVEQTLKDVEEGRGERSASLVEFNLEVEVQRKEASGDSYIGVSNATVSFKVGDEDRF